MTSHELPTKANDLVTEARLFANLALPSVIIQLGEFLIWTENAMYIGQTQGSTALAAISLANLCGNMSALVLLFGMLSGMDTLAPQEYGAGRKRQVGLLAQRATLVCTGIYPFVALVWFQMPWILYQLGQPEDVNVMASAYLRIYIWALPPMVLFDIARRFLAVQNIVRPFVWIMILVPLVVHPIFLWTFVTYCQMGMNGTAVAVTCSFTFAGGVTALHLKYNRPKRPSATWVCLGTHNNNARAFLLFMFRDSFFSFLKGKTRTIMCESIVVVVNLFFVFVTGYCSSMCPEYARREPLKKSAGGEKFL
eukprot:m.289893 g.289893  ORF g.289893 m.289893 type:complete len:308 (+) comp19973_c0_seq2:196-1119(+)